MKKIVLYVNFEEKEIINEKTFLAMIANKTEEYYDDEFQFFDWLNGNYSKREIFETEKENILKDYHNTCHLWAEEDIDECYTEFVIENIEDYVIEEE